MKVYLLMGALFLTACSSTEKLKESKSCSVWEEQGILGPRSVEVIGNVAEWKGRCSFFWFWGCQWVKADMPENEESIYLDGNGIFNNRKVVAKMKNEVVTYESTFLDSIVKSSPLVIDQKKLMTTRTVTTSIGNMQTQEEFYFNQACSIKQIGIGAIALTAIKNRQ